MRPPGCRYFGSPSPGRTIGRPRRTWRRRRSSGCGNRRAEVDWSLPVLPWLLVTTRRTATDRFRRLRRALAVRGPIEVVPGSDARIEWLDLRASFRALSALERSALVLTALEDLDAAQAGEILGIAANAVRSAASRGRKKLKEQR